MANTYSDLIPKLFKLGLPRLRGRLTMPRYAYTDISPEPAEKGDVVNIRLPVETEDEEDFTATFNPSLNDSTAETVPCELKYHKSASMNLTDKEFNEIIGGVATSGLESCMDKISRGMNKRGFDLYKDVYQYHEELDGSNNIQHPFTSDISSIAEVDRQLFEQDVEDDRSFVLNSWGRYNLFQQDQFNDASRDPQNAENFREARLGRKLGFGFDADNQAPKHTAGSGVTGDPTVNGSHSEGATTVNVACDSDDSVDFKDGDPISIDGENYTVKTDVSIASSNNANVELRQGLRTALSGGEAVDQVATESHSINLAFGKYAFGLAVRAPQRADITGEGEGGLVIASDVVQDPITGMPMRVQILGGLGVKKVVFDVIYGWATLRAKEAVRLAGKF